MCRVCVGVFCSMLSVLYAVGLSEPGLKHQQFRRKRQKITIISAARIVHSLLLFAVVCLDKGTHILRMGGVGTCNAREGRASATRMGPRAATGTGTHVDESVLGESSLLVEEVVDLFEQEPRSSRGQAEVVCARDTGRGGRGNWQEAGGSRTGHCFWLPSVEVSTTVLGGIGLNLGALARPREPLGSGVMPKVYLYIYSTRWWSIPSGVSRAPPRGGGRTTLSS